MKFFLVFLYRLLKHLLIFLSVSLPLEIIGAIVLIPLIVLGYDIGALPSLFRWFDSADPYICRDVTTINTINTEGKIAKYYWLAFRNPINYFSYKYLSFTWNSPKILIYLGDAQIGDSNGDHPGLKYIEVEQDNKTYYEYYYIKKLNENHCLRFRMGWKIGDPSDNKDGDIQQDVLVLQPIKSYSGV